MGRVDALANELARGQDGLVTRAQLPAVGISDRTIRRRLRSGEWRLRLPGVIDLGTHPPTWWQSARALLLAAGDDGVLSHDTAAVLHGLPDVRLPDVPDVLVPRGRHPAVAGHRLHTTVRMGADEVVEVDGRPATSAARTVVDCAPRRTDDWLQVTIGQLVRRRLTTVAAVVESAALRPGAAATGRVIRACAGLPPHLDHTESPLEVRGVITLARLGLQPPALQYCVRLRGRDYRFDAAWPALRVAVEFDSAAWHDTELRSGADAVKDGAADAERWVVVRLRERDLRHPSSSSEIARLRSLVL